MTNSAPMPYESLASPDQDLTFDTASEAFARAGSEFGEPQMRSMGLLDGDKYTNLALLLSDQCPQGIGMVCYGDGTGNGFLEKAEASGSLLSQYKQASDFVDRHNNLRSRTGRMRCDIRDYPESAVREVIVNALVHRDYSIPGSTLLSMCGRSMSVSSVGGPPGGLTAEDLLLGITSPRNGKLAAVMCRLGLMESYGTGISRIMGAYGGDPNRPIIETNASVFRITLPKMSFPGLGPRAQKVSSRYVPGDVFSRSDLEAGFGLTRNQAYSVINELISEGIVESIGSGRTLSYRKL